LDLRRGRGRLRCFRLRFTRFGFRACHSLPPGPGTHQAKNARRQALILAVEAHHRRSRHKAEIRNVRRKNLRSLRGHATILWGGSGKSREGAHPQRASGARRLEKCDSKHCEALNIRWTPRKRNGYYSKQIFSSMRVCDEVKKLTDSSSGIENRKKRSARSRLRPEKAVIDSPGLRPPLFFLGIGGVASWGRLRNPLWRSRAMGLVSTDRHLADHLRQHLFFHGEDVVVASRGFSRGRRDRSSLHRYLHSDGTVFVAAQVSLAISSGDIAKAVLPRRRRILTATSPWKLSGRCSQRFFS